MTLRCSGLGFAHGRPPTISLCTLPYSHSPPPRPRRIRSAQPRMSLCGRSASSPAISSSVRKHHTRLKSNQSRISSETCVLLLGHSLSSSLAVRHWDSRTRPRCALRPSVRRLSTESIHRSLRSNVFLNRHRAPTRLTPQTYRSHPSRHLLSFVMSRKRKFGGYEQREASPTSNKRSKCKSPQREPVDCTGDSVTPTQRQDAAPSGSNLQASGSGIAPPPSANPAPVTTAHPRQAFPRDGGSLMQKQKLKPKCRDERKRRLQWREEVKAFPASRPDILHDREIHLTPPPPAGERLPEDHGSGRASAGAPCIVARSPASLGSHLAATSAFQPGAAGASQTQEGRLSLGSATPSLAHSTFGGEGSHSPWAASSSASPYSNALTPTGESAYTVSAASRWPNTPWAPGVDTSSSGSMSPPLNLATMSQPTNGISPLSDPYNGSFIPLENSQAAYARFLAQFEDDRLRRLRAFGTTGSSVTVPQPSAAAISDGHPHGPVGGAAAYYRHRLELAISPPPRPRTRRSGSIAANAVAPHRPSFHPQTATQRASSGFHLSDTTMFAESRNWDAPASNVASASTADGGSSTRTSTAASDASDSSSPRTYAASAVVGLGYGPTNSIVGWREGTLATGQSATPPSDMPPPPMSDPANAGGSQRYRQRGQTESSLAHWNLP